MIFRVLGPLEVCEDERVLQLGGRQQRAVLVFLLLSRNEPVSVDQLVEGIWSSGSTPSSALKTVQVYVSHLRRILGEGRVETHGKAYLLRVRPGELDVDELERLTAEARDARPEEAAGLLRKALDLFRGDPLSDVRYEDFARAEVSRLEELRLQIVEQRIDADLACGKHAALIPELEGLTQQHPLRERLRGQLMLALYQSGRQADALAAYRETRALLNRELGLEPSPELRELEQAILRQDPTIATPAKAAVERRSDRRLLALVVIGAMLLIGAASAAATVELTSSSSGLGTVSPASVAAIDTRSNAITAQIPAGSRPSQIAVTSGDVWVLNSSDGTVTRIDPSRRRSSDTFSTQSIPTDLVAGGGSVWVANKPASGTSAQKSTDLPISVSEFDPRTHAKLRTIPLPPTRGGPSESGRPPGVSLVTAGGGFVWAIGPGQSLYRIDPKRGGAVEPTPVHARALAYGLGSLWVIDFANGNIDRISPTSGRVVQRISIPSLFPLESLAVGGDAVWATSPFQGTLWRTDPGPPSGEQSIAIGFGASSVAYGAGSVWVGNDVADSVSRVDPRTNTIVKVFHIPSPQGIAVGKQTAWISSGVSERRTGALTTTACGNPIAPGAAAPGVLIASDLPLQGFEASYASSAEQAIQLVLQQHGYRAGRYRVGYQSCDDSTAAAGGTDDSQCYANAEAYAVDRSIVGVVGPLDSECANHEIPVLARGPAGPVATVSPLNTVPSLTRPLIGLPSTLLQAFYPKGVRHYARVIGADHIQVAADAVLAKQLGIHRIAVVYNHGFGSQSEKAWFSYAAMRIGGPRTLGESWSGPTDTPRLVSQLRTAHADALFLASPGALPPAIAGLLNATRKAFGARFPIIVTDQFWPWPVAVQALGNTVNGIYASEAGITSMADLPPAGRALVGQLPKGARITWVAATAAQATQVLLDAIARSNGTRASIIHALQHTNLTNGYAGPITFDRNGDPTTAPITIFRIHPGGHNATGTRDFQDATIDRVITPPTAAVPPP